jgi:exopolysaccharide biosynthesis polyprenyl glycosylphosphotransferase
MKHPPEKTGAVPWPHLEPGPPRRIILVGARRAARRLARRLGEQAWVGPHVVGFVDAGHGRASHLRPPSRHLALHPQADPVPVLGSIERLDELVDRARATHVLVAVSHTPEAHKKPHVSQLIKSDVPVHWVSVESGKLDAGTLVSASGALTPGHSTPKPSRRGRRLHFLVWDHINRVRLAKRLLDFTLAMTALILLAPLLVAASVAVLVGSGRPILYTQERVGQGGRRFRIYKFRSMRCDAEHETGPIWASDHDSRCTRVGDWLRHTNIDELPQLFNVLRGDMSLVGPRPERPTFVEQFRQSVPDYDLRHAVRGGMTGWAQVHGWRGRTSLRKRIQYDLDYIERWSFWLDVRILFMTIQHVCWGKTTWKEPKRSERPAG